MEIFYLLPLYMYCEMRKNDKVPLSWMDRYRDDRHLLVFAMNDSEGPQLNTSAPVLVIKIKGDINLWNEPKLPRITCVTPTATILKL